MYHLQIKGTDCFFFNEGSCKQNIFDEASKRQIHDQIIKAQRGIIYDRNKNILAMSLPAKTLCINPYKLFYKDHNTDVRKLSNILDMPYAKLKKIINKNKDRKRIRIRIRVE